MVWAKSPRPRHFTLPTPRDRPTSSHPIGGQKRRFTSEGVGDLTNVELETRLAVAETELRALKELVAELRASRDSWQA
jgi:hypothetical protein